MSVALVSDVLPAEAPMPVNAVTAKAVNGCWGKQEQNGR